MLLECLGEIACTHTTESFEMCGFKNHRPVWQQLIPAATIKDETHTVWVVVLLAWASASGMGQCIRLLNSRI